MAELRCAMKYFMEIFHVNIIFSFDVVSRLLHPPTAWLALLLYNIILVTEFVNRKFALL